MTAEITTEILKDIFIQKLENGQFGFPADFDCSWIKDALMIDMERLNLPYVDSDGIGYDLEYAEKIFSEVEFSRQRVVEGKLPAIYAGIINKGTVQAEFQRIPLDTAGLIVIDAGLVTYTYLIAKILFEATPNILPGDTSEEYPRVSDDSGLRKGDKWIAPTLNKEQANLLFHNVIENAIAGNSRNSYRIPITLESTYFGASKFADSCVRFTMAHELGHVISGIEEIPFDIESKFELSANHIEEFRCDMFAYWCLIEYYKYKMESASDMNSRSDAALELVAPVILFKFNHYLRICSVVSKGGNTIDYKDHPPDFLRIRAMLFMLAKENLLEQVSSTIKVLSQHATNYHNFLVEQYGSGVDGEYTIGINFLEE